MASAPSQLYGCSPKQFLRDRLLDDRIGNAYGERRRQWRLFDLSDGFFGLPTRPCCYVLYLDGVLAYVGCTENLQKRMKGHFIYQNDRRFYGIQFKSIYGSVTVKAKFPRRFGDWAMTELRLIKRLQPKHNKRGKISRPVFSY